MLSSIKQIIDQTAARYGVASWVAEDIAIEESGGNPSSVGDHGTSFGLYQLHWGGQGTGYTAGQLEDPVLNAQIGISHLANAYKRGVSSGLSGWNLLDYTATYSGHPGSAGPGNYPSYEKSLYSVYTGQGGKGSMTTINGASAPSSSTASTAPNSFPAASNVIDAIDQSLQIQGFNIANPLGSITQDAGAIGLRLVIVLIGLLCVAFGLYAAVERAS